MPLSKLENLIKNTEGNVLYVNPNDIDATDGIENQGNSLARPFKTIQRALIESARFSYVKGNENDLTNKTTILCFPGEHLIDNRPGFLIKDDSGTPRAVSPAGTESLAQDTFSLSLQSIFDLSREDNILYKFNSVNGGIIIPRGTSIVGLDLRKTKIRPKYVPNPTDVNLPGSTIFRVTGGCYFNSFTFFDGDENGQVYTDNSDFGTGNRSRPLFSHHKLSCFEFADGVNIVDGYSLTDLDMYYAKLSNAFNNASGRNVDQKFPALPEGFTSQRSEFEIVGAFASDPLSITALSSGDGVTAGNIVTVTTSTDHGLTVGTPIKIRGIIPVDYNTSTVVTSVIDKRSFTYTLSKVSSLLNGTGATSGATVTVETDTVSGASPYIFNVSLRSVFGMNGIVGDGSKATGFKSIVLAQFTAISLQKDDRSFVKYNEVSRVYEGINITRVTGADLPEGSASTSSSSVYHLDPRAIYREGWETAHISMTNDSIFQIVSVFAIGFNKHFDAQTGADASITNSNSNFGQIALVSDGFKADAFTKDDQGYITSIIAPKSVLPTETNVEYLTLDVGLTTAVGVSSHLYIFGYNERDVPPTEITQGFRVGARKQDQLHVVVGNDTASAQIQMVNTDMSVGAGNTVAFGDASSEKVYSVNSVINSELSIAGSSVDIQTGEKIRLISDDGDLPENIEDSTIYFAIKTGATTYKIASTLADALKNEPISIYGGTNLTLLSRVSDKASGELGHPIQFDEDNNNWFVHTETNSGIYTTFAAQGVAGVGANNSNRSTLKRIVDARGLDDKLYKVRYFIPKETSDARAPRVGFVVQETSNTGVRTDTDFTVTGITTSDYAFDRNPSFISTCAPSGNTITVISNQDHKLFTGDTIVIKNAKSTTNTVGAANSGYNGKFVVTGVSDSKTFTYSVTDTSGITHSVGDFTSDINTRTTDLPRFERNDLQSNLYIYRSDTIQEYVPGSRDGIYHLFLLKADNSIDTEFTTKKYSSAVENLYPQLDKDNLNDNPFSTKSFAKRAPLGDVSTDDQRKSLTRETIDVFTNKIGLANTITTITTDSVSGITTLTLEREHGLNGISTYASLTGGSGFTAGTYEQVKLINDGTSAWFGALARVNVASGGAVDNVIVTAPGSGYAAAQQLNLDGFSGASVTLGDAGIRTSTDVAIQLSGVGNTASPTYKVASIPADNQVAFAFTGGDPLPKLNQFVYNCGPTAAISTVTYNSTAGVATFTCNNAHGLLVGNSFKLIDTDNNNTGEYFVNDVVGINTFSARVLNDAVITNINRVLPVAFGAKGENISAESEAFAKRQFTFFNGDTATLVADITDADDANAIRLSITGISTAARFPLGSYVQIEDEVMRITSAELSGANNDSLSVIRGYFGTPKVSHKEGALIKAIKVLPVELRRNSILRASGHTFEYLGYGPGNYSTGLPQVQTTTLTERETFLAQAQERSAGVVVYTGMNNDGDFYIGNKKINSANGTETVFDVPIPTSTGQASARLAVVFDEVTIKDSIVVEGGSSNALVSQFDGPVTFNQVVRTNNELKATTFDVSGTATFEGEVILNGGLTLTSNVTSSGWGKFQNVQLGVSSATTLDVSTGDLILDAPEGNHVAIDTTLKLHGDGKIYGDLYVTGDITAFWSSDERLKNDIHPIKDPLEKVLSLSGNTFTWNEKSKYNGTEDVGLIAQEVEAVLPEAVTEKDTGYLGVRYDRVIPLLVEAVKELSGRVNEIEDSISLDDE